jgi:hypothetical protein
MILCMLSFCFSWFSLQNTSSSVLICKEQLFLLFVFNPFIVYIFFCCFCVFLRFFHRTNGCSCTITALFPIPFFVYHIKMKTWYQNDNDLFIFFFGSFFIFVDLWLLVLISMMILSTIFAQVLLLLYCYYYFLLWLVGCNIIFLSFHNDFWIIAYEKKMLFFSGIFFLFVHSFGLVYHILWKLAYLRKLLRKFHEIFLVQIFVVF